MIVNCSGPSVDDDGVDRSRMILNEHANLHPIVCVCNYTIIDASSSQVMFAGWEEEEEEEDIFIKFIL